MTPATRAMVTVLGALLLTGILAAPALGDQCVEGVEWEDVLCVAHGTPHGAPVRGARLGEGEIPPCPGGRCAPSADRLPVFALEGVEPWVAVAAGESVFLGPGTFPALPDHPLHEAIFGSPALPSYRRSCAEPFRFSGEVTIADFSLRVDVAEPVPKELEVSDEGEAWIELDAETRVEGFDQNGVARIDVGEQVDVTGRVCEGEVGLLADLIQPAD